MKTHHVRSIGGPPAVMLRTHVHNINDENERHVCCSKLAGLHADIIRTPIPRRTHPFCSKAIPLLKPQCVLKAAKTI